MVSELDWERLVLGTLEDSIFCSISACWHLDPTRCTLYLHRIGGTRTVKGGNWPLHVSARPAVVCGVGALLLGSACVLCLCLCKSYIYSLPSLQESFLGCSMSDCGLKSGFQTPCSLFICKHDFHCFMHIIVWLNCWLVECSSCKAQCIGSNHASFAVQCMIIE